MDAQGPENQFVEIHLSYKGQDFLGWQWQKTSSKSTSAAISVQECLETAIKNSMCGLCNICEICRPDRGMSATDLVVLFENPKNLPVGDLKDCLSNNTPETLQIRHVHACNGKALKFKELSYKQIYCFYAYYDPQFVKELSPYALYMSKPLDVELMKTAGREILSPQRIFQTCRIDSFDVTATNVSTNHTILQNFGLNLTRKFGLIIYEFKFGGIGNLKNTLRAIVPVLKDIGLEAKSLSEFKSYLDGKRKFGPLLKPSYIWLMSMEYSIDAFQPSSIERKKLKTEVLKSKLDRKRTKTVVIEPPEGHVLGNFHNYYEFNSVSERLSQIPERVWNEFASSTSVTSLLDIGCNDGSLTLALQSRLERFGTVNCLGIDVDSDLIKRGIELAAKTNSACTFKTCNVMDVNSYQDVIKPGEQFDLVACFGVTMWIHLNHGDDGLIRFLEIVLQLTRKVLILEPQIWKNYKSAKGRIRKAGADVPNSFKSLKITGDHIMETIDQVLLHSHPKDDRFTEKQILGETKWKRQVIMYTKTNS